MYSRLATHGLYIGIVLLYVSPVEAQFRLFRDRRSTISRVNPIHERYKREAEQAYQKGDYQRTIELVEIVLSQNPRDHVAYHLRGSARVELGLAQGDAPQVRAGIADARQAISLASPKAPDYYLPYLYGMTHLAAIENRKEHAETAVKVAEEIISAPGLQTEQKANLLFQRAMAHVQLKDFDAAVADYEQAIKLQPTHLGAHVGLADAYSSAGKHDEALSAFDKAIRAFPSNPVVHNNRGMYLQQRGKLQEALIDFTRALELDERYLYAYVNRGYTLMQLGDAEAAESDFDMALKLDSNQPMVYGMRGSSLLDQGKLAAAVADYRRVTNLDSRNAAAYADLGFAEFFAKDYARALAAFERAVELDSNSLYLRPWQFLAMESAGRADEARKKFGESGEQTTGEKDWVENLLAYLTGDISEKELLKAAGSSDEQTQKSQRCEAHFFIGQRKSRAGESEEASAHFRQALETKVSHLSAYRGARFALKKFNASSNDESPSDVQIAPSPFD